MALVLYKGNISLSGHYRTWGGGEKGGRSCGQKKKKRKKRRKPLTSNDSVSSTVLQDYNRRAGKGKTKEKQ